VKSRNDISARYNTIPIFTNVYIYLPHIPTLTLFPEFITCTPLSHP
jgi:hypothetical protein